mmetsp:Transcript_49313/g.117327  ORF Transcript_49313/g.117327 Transcript_49313/m.117327 type:complete len:206 (-) Transcript_49313:194-811(-)
MTAAAAAPRSVAPAARGKQKAQKHPCTASGRTQSCPRYACLLRCICSRPADRPDKKSPVARPSSSGLEERGAHKEVVAQRQRGSRGWLEDHAKVARHSEDERRQRRVCQNLRARWVKELSDGGPIGHDSNRVQKKWPEWNLVRFVEVPLLHNHISHEARAPGARSGKLPREDDVALKVATAVGQGILNTPSHVHVHDHQRRSEHL